MWGGEYALKFYADADAAATEFGIYRQATVRACHLLIALYSEC
jgi:hypothetical protein